MKNDKQLIPKKRFKEFDNNDIWEQQKLQDVAQINMGQSPSSKNYTDNPADNILVQGNADMKNGLVVPRVWTTQVTKKAEKGDIILSVRAPVGDVGKTNYDVVLGRGVAAIKGNEFIFQLLSRMKEKKYWSKLSTGSTFESINSNDIKDAHIIIPSDIEQSKIGLFFKSWDNLINLQQRKLAKIKDLKSAYLSDLFPKEGEKYPKLRFEEFTKDWHYNDLNNIADRYDNLRIPITASDRISGNTPYYGANGIQDFVKGFTHNGEYILIAEDGANDISDYPVHYVNGKVWVNNHAHVIQAKKNIANNKFLMYAFKNLDIERFLVGGGRAKLNANIMMDMIITIPDINEQTKIGEFFNKLDESIVYQEKKLEKLEKIKQAYLNEMFV